MPQLTMLEKIQDRRAREEVLKMEKEKAKNPYYLAACLESLLQDYTMAQDELIEELKANGQNEYAQRVARRTSRKHEQYKKVIAAVMEPVDPYSTN